MIIEAIYTGIMPDIIKPGTKETVIRPDDSGKWPAVKIRLIDGQSLGGCWKITKGKKEYEAALAAAQEKRLQRDAEKKAAAEERRRKMDEARDAEFEREMSTLVGRGERDLTSAKSREATTKPDEENS